MTIVTADETLLQYFREADGPVAVRDASGNVVGFIAPVTPDQVSTYARALLELQLGPERRPPNAEFDLAEAERRLARPATGNTLDKIFEACQLLTDDPAARADLQRHIEAIRERNGCPSR